MIIENESIKFKQMALVEPLLKTMNVRSLVCPMTSDLLGIAFDHNGYIAGGFGTLMARFLVLNENKNNYVDFHRTIRQHLGFPISGPRPEKTPIWKHNTGIGDIDVWFPNVDSLNGFLNDPRRLLMIEDGVSSLKMSSIETVTGTAIEHIISGCSKVQIITKFLMPMEEQLSRFDIYNGMVGLTSDSVVFPEHWKSLECAKMLHVSTWKTPWTINRFFKWLTRKNYTSVTKPTANTILDEAIKSLEWYKDERSVLSADDMKATLSKSLLMKRVATMPGHVQEFLKPIMSSLPSERLLEISALFKATKYDRAMQEIRHRMPPT